jgi:AcrR family transcriptional regulator
MEARAARKRPASRRKRAQHLGPERRRPQLLDAALELFLERGYEGTSMEAIAEAAGVSKPVVYSAFEGKEQLFRALLRREEDRILSEITAAFQNTNLDDPEKALTDGFTAFFRAVDSSPEVYRLIFFQEGGGNAAIAKRIRRGREAQVEALAALARTWLSAGGEELDADELERLSGLIGQAIAGLAEGGARTLLGNRDAWTPEALGQTLGRLATRGQTAVQPS